MQKQDFETHQKRFRDFEILPAFSDTHVFRGTIHHPYLPGRLRKNGTVAFASMKFSLLVQRGEIFILQLK